MINKVYKKYSSQQEFIDFMKTKCQFQEQKSQWNENEVWYASEDQATNSAEEQEHHWDASKASAANLAEEHALQENKSDQEIIFIDW